jgi:phosphate transport system substrate-binding protein
MKRPGFIGVLLCAAMAAPALGEEAGIHGAGATFPYPVYAAWAAQYRQVSGVHVTYEPVGSGAGVERFERGAVDFGATDVPLTAGELQRIGAMQFPTVIGGVVPVVNVAGIQSGRIRLSGQVLADIYLGKVTKWNAPAIAGLNPGLHLPSSNITVVHRADASGTTYLWSDFLSRSSVPWRMEVGAGKTVAWPTGVAATGNDGVAASVRRTRASIGYVEYSYARQHHLATASVRNHDGAFVQAGRASFEAAASQARWRDGADLQQSLVDLPGPATWPVVSASFVLLPTRPGTPERTRAAIDFFDWALAHGQSIAVDLDYVPLPDAALALIRRAWMDQVQDAAGRSLGPAPVR